MNEKSALIAMSGGVDSSCAAFLMREQGYECMGTTMRLYRNEDLGACNFRTCCSEKNIEDASEVAFQREGCWGVLVCSMGQGSFHDTACSITQRGLAFVN